MTFSQMRLPMYEVRFGKFGERSSRGAEQVRTRVDEAVHGRG